MKTRSEQEAREGGAQEEKEVEAGVPVWVAQARDMRAQLRGIKFTGFTSTEVQMLTPEPTSLRAADIHAGTRFTRFTSTNVQILTLEPPIAELRMRIHRR